MASFFTICLVLILVSFQPSEAKTTTEIQTYIVHLRAPDHITNLLQRESWYASLLSQVVSDDKSPHARLVSSYHHVFHGFAAKLTPDEFEALKRLEVVVSAWPDTMEYPHTTHSPQFMGLNTSVGGFWEKAEYGSGITIGVFDSGINPDDHPSFKGDGSPPKEWDGKCEAPIRCNNKVIGARSFTGGSPADETGHGSHVASTAAGYMVAVVVDKVPGVASGVGPNFQLAVYKVCTAEGCPGYAVLNAFEAAILDGVDVISISLGPKSGAPPLYMDGKAIGAFVAMQRGIFVSVSAGNEGPLPGTVGNEAPWYLSVGASTTDREIQLDGIRSVLEPEDGIGRLRETSFGNPHAPTVADFSSRGPTTVAKGIIKPDIIGPGVQIIAASRTGDSGLTIMSGTSMACPHLSGAAGLIKKLHPDWSTAAIKSALMTTAYQTNLGKGAIEDGENNQTATPYDMGAGHVDVVKANDPGLVFDINPDDYIPYLCTDLGYSSEEVSALVSTKVDCATYEVTTGSSLNLPSIWVDLREQVSVTVPRTFTNVGSDASEVYKVATVIDYTYPNTFHISVDPQELQFSDLGIKKEFQLTFTRPATQQWTGINVAASVVWSSDKHVVRSPIMVAL